MNKYLKKGKEGTLKLMKLANMYSYYFVSL